MERKGVNATQNEHEQVVEEIVRTILDALPGEGEHTYRDAAEYDLKRLSPVELATQFQDAEQLLRGLYNTAEGMGVVMQAIHRDCLERVEEAHERAKRAAGIE